MKTLKQQKPSMQDLLSFFPEIAFPVTLTEESAEAFSKENKALPPIILQEYLMQWENGQVQDDLTEYVPCLKVTETDDYIGLVYWKASLMNYEYIMVSITKSGELISRKVVASTILEGEIVKKIGCSHR